MKKQQTLKFLIVGDSGVGKTSILMRYCEDKFHTDFLSTIGVDFKVKKIETQSHMITLNIWDTAGQQRFRNITKTFYKGAHGVILVYAINDRNSFNKIQNWIYQVRQNGSSTANMILVGSKADLQKQRKVSKKQGKQMAQKTKMIFVETSAKQNQNISKVFEKLASDIIETGSVSPQKGKKIESKPKNKKQGCC